MCECARSKQRYAVLFKSLLYVYSKASKGTKKSSSDADVCVTYVDIRTNFKDAEEFVRGVMENERVRYIRGRVGKVFPVNDRLIVRAEDVLMGTL